MLNSMVATFNATNACQITVELENQDSYSTIREKMQADLLIFHPPNLLLGDQRDEALYALQGRIIDLAPLIGDIQWGMTFDELQDFFPAFLEQGVHPEFRGQRLGFPANRTLEVLYYNQTWLRELEDAASTAPITASTLTIAGTPPRTPEQFRAMACAAAAGKADGTGGYILRTDAAALTAWTLAFGGDVLSPDGKGYVYNGDATIQAMTFLKELYDAKCAYFFTEGDTVPNAFATREAIFTQGPSAAIPFYELAVQTAAENQERTADQWNLTTLPYTTTANAQTAPMVNAYGIDLMIPPTTPEGELAAWIVLKWFTAPEQQAQWVQISHDYPTRASTIEYLDDYVQHHPQWATGFELLDHCAYEPPLISYSYEGVRSAVSEAMVEILLNGADIQETLRILNEEANLIQEEMMQQVDNETP
jgi:multiple sugar transport system substrate-binding protein/sn-glycerol 3-phosphate transport system substrate-binding protein